MNLKSYFYLVFIKKNGYKLNVFVIYFDIFWLVENKFINIEMLFLKLLNCELRLKFWVDDNKIILKKECIKVI